MPPPYGRIGTARHMGAGSPAGAGMGKQLLMAQQTEKMEYDLPQSQSV